MTGTLSQSHAYCMAVDAAALIIVFVFASCICFGFCRLLLYAQLNYQLRGCLLFAPSVMQYCGQLGDCEQFCSTAPWCGQPPAASVLLTISVPSIPTCCVSSCTVWWLFAFISCFNPPLLPLL
jgi:hypothetical protein